MTESHFRLVEPTGDALSTDEQIERLADMVTSGQPREEIRRFIEEINTRELQIDHAGKLDFLARKVDGFLDKGNEGLVWFD